MRLFLKKEMDMLHENHMKEIFSNALLLVNVWSDKHGIKDHEINKKKAVVALIASTKRVGEDEEFDDLNFLNCVQEFLI